MRHLWIPDCQVKPKVRTDHMDWAGHAILEYQPDTIIGGGDFWDMSSLSSYATAEEKELARYEADVEAGNRAMQRLLSPYRQYLARRRKRKGVYRPRFVFVMGNHEYRIIRAVQAQPMLKKVIGYQDLDLRGWQVIPFQKPVNLDGILYAHYFYSVNSGKPYGGTTHNKLKNIGVSFTMGHQQGLDYAMRQLPNGRRQYGLVAGSFYLHDEAFRGPQANGEWRGVIVKNDVRHGEYDLMPLSMKYLRERFA